MTDRGAVRGEYDVNVPGRDIGRLRLAAIYDEAWAGLKSPTVRFTLAGKVRITAPAKREILTPPTSKTKSVDYSSCDAETTGSVVLIAVVEVVGRRPRGVGLGRPSGEQQRLVHLIPCHDGLYLVRHRGGQSCGGSAAKAWVHSDRRSVSCKSPGSIKPHPSYLLSAVWLRGRGWGDRQRGMGQVARKWQELRCRLGPLASGPQFRTTRPRGHLAFNIVANRGGGRTSLALPAHGQTPTE